MYRDSCRYIHFVPPFQEEEVDKYCMHFEKIAFSLKWPEDIWTVLLQSVLVGMARDIYSALPVEQSARYTVVKESILKAYELVPEAYRQKFRSTSKGNKQTFARDKERLFDRCCVSQNVDVETLRSYSSCWLRSSRTIYTIKSRLTWMNSLQQVAVLADEYTLTYQRVFPPKTDIVDTKSCPPPPINGLGQG